MADYDVQPLALSSPPQPAYVTSYRPAVSVRNNGVHDAYAAGLLRIYTAGQLIFTTQILSGNIAPGQSKDALGLEYWTPPAPGTYMCFAHVTCEHDQVPSNDNLAPVTFSVSGLPPPPPPGVTAHAAQHEEGAADEIDLDGMRGLLEDPQTAAAHAATHQEAGSDELDVTGLHGALADPQPTANHANERHTTPFATVTNLTDHIAANPAHQLAANLEHVENKGAPSGYASLDLGAKVPAVQLGGPLTPSPDSFLRQDQTWTKPPTQIHVPTHESGGDDELSIADLHGQLGDLQPVAAHHNSHAAGGSDEITVAGLQGVLAEPQVPSNHTAVAHDTSVEATAHKGAASGYAPLGLDAKVPVANLPGMPPTAHAATHQDGGSDELSIAGLSGKAADAQTPLNHGATHGHEGGDDISIGGLSGMPAAAGVPLGLATLDISGKLTPAQTPPPATHGNEAHEPAFQPSNQKGAPNGYAPLDTAAKVPLLNLPTIELTTHGAELHYNALTSTPTTPGWAGLPGTETTVSRGDHAHNSPGVISAILNRLQLNPTDPEKLLILATVPNGRITPDRVIRISGRGWYSLFQGFPNTWNIILRTGTYPLFSDNPIRLEIQSFIPSGETNSALPFSYDFHLSARTATSWFADAQILYDNVLQAMAPPNIVRFSGLPVNPQPFPVSNVETLYLSISAVKLVGEQPAVVLYQERAIAERLQ